MVPFYAFGAEEQSGAAKGSSSMYENSAQVAEGQVTDAQVADSQATDAQAADEQATDEQNAALQTVDSQEGIAYRVPTFIDPSHYEKGMKWNTEYCTDYTLLSTLSDEQMDNLGPGWYVLDRTISRKRYPMKLNNVNMILCDGCSLTLDTSWGDPDTMCECSGTVSFYGQEKGTGTLMFMPLVSAE